MASYIDTYYARTLGPSSVRPALRGNTEADVCIVGGGLAGISTALELLRLGHTVAIVEAKRIAWGASGRNGGIVSPGYSTSFEKIEKRAGEASAHALHRLSIEGVDMVAANIDSLGIEAAGRKHGTLSVSRYENKEAMLRKAAWLETHFNYPLVYKSREETAALLASDKYRQALHDPRAFQFHPLNYAQALAAEIERLGGQIFEDSEVVAADCDGPAKRVQTAQGSVTARHVVFTGGGYTGGLVPSLARSYVPIATYMLQTAPAREQIASAIRTPFAVGDSRRASDYYRLVDDGARILWGGMITTRVSEPLRLADLLRRRMVDTYPQLEGLQVEVAWSGLMSYARHLMPLIGQLKPGVWYGMGFGGHGMNTTAIGGRVIAEGIAGASRRHELFAPFGLEWTGGAAGKAAVQMTYWYYQLRDFMQERAA